MEPVFGSSRPRENPTVSAQNTWPLRSTVSPCGSALASGIIQSLTSAVRGSTRPIRFGTLRSVDRKSTRLNSSHTVISYAVFCLKKKKRKRNDQKDQKKKTQAEKKKKRINTNYTQERRKTYNQTDYAP